MSDSVKVHPLNGKRALVILPYGFIYFGLLTDLSGDLETGYALTDAANLRGWETRDEGLSEFIEKGPIAADNIDPIGTIYFDSAVLFCELGDWAY